MGIHDRDYGPRDREEKMTAIEISRLSRESRNTILRAMIAKKYPMGPRPTLTAYKILDMEMSAEPLWQWYAEMAEFTSRA